MVNFKEIFSVLAFIEKLEYMFIRCKTKVSSICYYYYTHILHKNDNDKTACISKLLQDKCCSNTCMCQSVSLT